MGDQSEKPTNFGDVMSVINYVMANGTSGMSDDFIHLEVGNGQIVGVQSGSISRNHLGFYGVRLTFSSWDQSSAGGNQSTTAGKNEGTFIITTKWIDLEKFRNDYNRYEFLHQFDNTVTVANAYGISSGVKDIAIDYAAASKLGTKLWDKGNLAGAFGKQGSRILTGVKFLGYGAAIASAAYSGFKVADQIRNGGLAAVNTRDAVDAGVGVVGVVGILAAGTPVGWASGAGVLVYSAFTFFWDAAN